MAVATAAATTMAKSADAGRPRRNTAARTSMRKNIEVWAERARLAARSRPECDMLTLGPGALIVPLAAQTPDPDRRPAGLRQRGTQTGACQHTAELTAA